MLRLFVALPLPVTVCNRLADLQHGLPGARWVDPDSMHLTLRFIGEVEGHVARDIDDVLAGLRAKAVRLTLSGVGVFGGAAPRVLWAGLVRNPALEHLAEKVETAMRRIGLAPDTRRFSPHVTLARLRDVAPDRLAQWIARNNLFGTEEFAVSGMTLFSSHPGNEAPHYIAERDYPLS